MGTRDLTRFLLALGLALVAGGLLLGFLPRSASGVSCGSAFHATSDAQVQDYGSTLADSAIPYDPASSYASRCADARSAARTPAIALLAVGAVLTIAGAVGVAGDMRPATVQTPPSWMGKVAKPTGYLDSPSNLAEPTEPPQVYKRYQESEPVRERVHFDPPDPAD